MLKSKYIELMEKVLSAYSDEHILRYFNDVKLNGLTEHGFPRLTANIGILIAHGRRLDLSDIFREMMDFCCMMIPKVKAANDFSVREIVCCIAELEKSRTYDISVTEDWKRLISEIEPEKCYSVYARTPSSKVNNWALFTAVSEFFRQRAGLCDQSEFIDTQLASQLQWIDENGMYRDNLESDVHQPIVYDLVPRGLFSLLLDNGYCGKYRDEIDSILRKSGLHTLDMQSVTGEAAFGGRSNGFLHNEAWLAGIFEFEAKRHSKEGNTALANRFKSAADRATEVIEEWLKKTPITHIKNRFPVNTKYGCEGYAYFDKYMITAASFLYAAYLLCDDSIKSAEYDRSPIVWSTSAAFHKIFASAGDYYLEFDTNADPHYDACGLGRVHRKGAPSAVCLSFPCPAHPNYVTDMPDSMSASICPGIFENGKWIFGSFHGHACRASDVHSDSSSSSVTLEYELSDDRTVTAKHTIDENGVSIEISGKGCIACMLPAFSFDGENRTDISVGETYLNISYGGWECRYTASGRIENYGRNAANRSGHYSVYYVSGTDSVQIRIEIVKK